MFVFDIGLMLAIIFFANIVPGIIAGLAILKNVKQFELLEKILIGAAMGFLFPQLIPLLLSFVGIQYTYTLTIITLAITYILALTLLFLSFKLETIPLYIQIVVINFKKLWIDIQLGQFMKLMPAIFSITLIILLFFTFMIRFQTISPVFMELDPYFYSYAPIMVMEQGSVPLHDSLAWWPLNITSHRVMPSLIYLETNWYSLYTHGNMASVDSYILSEISSFYPPLSALFTIFFIYLLFKIGFNKEIGLAIAALLSFMPSYLYKTLAGVFEAQPMSFLLYAAILALIYSFIVFKDKKILIPLSIISFSAMLGATGSNIAATLVAIIFTILIVLNFIKYWITNGKEEFSKQENDFYLMAAVVLAIIFTVFSLLTDYYTNASITTAIIKNTAIVFIPIILAFLSKLIYEKNELFLTLRKNGPIIYGAIFISIILIMASPLGSVFIEYARLGFSAGNYNTPLERTVSEQQLSGSDLTVDLSALGTTIKVPILENVISFTSQLVNFLYNSVIQIVNSILGLKVPPIAKNPNIASLAILGFIGMTLLESYRFIIGKDHKIPVLLIFIAVLFYPLSIAGLIKSKYTIYFTFTFILMLGYFLGTIYSLLTDKIKPYLRNGLLNSKLISFATIFILFISPIVISSTSIAIASSSLILGNFADNPKAHLEESKAICAFVGNDSNNKACQFSADPDTFLSKIENQYSPDLCYYSLLYNEILNKTTNNDKIYSAGLRCAFINDYWLNSLEWMKTNLPDDVRVTSWWDYGHWTNYFSRKASVIRNEHSYPYMIQDIAHTMIMDNESDTIKTMEKYGSDYLMIDREIILNPDTIFGAKFYALNYLACSRDNLTNVNIPQMGSQCEYDNLWEEIMLTNKKCIISPISNEWGVIAQKRSVSSKDGIVQNTGVVDAYCVGNVTLADGSIIQGTYYLNKKTPAGELTLNKGFIYGTSSGSYIILYINQNAWIVNGEVVNGYDDRIGKGRFYDSALYKGFVLNELVGFTNVFDNGAVKIYKITK